LMEKSGVGPRERGRRPSRPRPRIAAAATAVESAPQPPKRGSGGHPSAGSHRAKGGIRRRPSPTKHKQERRARTRPPRLMVAACCLASEARKPPLETISAIGE
jgi:hypothetical protein